MARRQRRRICKLDRGANRAIVLGQRHHRFDDKINRHQIQTHVAVTDVQQRQSPGPTPQVVNQVIDAVILRRLAGTRIAAHDRGPVNGDRQFSLQRVNLGFGQVLCFFVVIAKAGLVMQFVLFDNTLAFAGDVASRDVVISLQMFN